MAKIKKDEEIKPGKISIDELKKLINKKAGINVAHDLSKEDLSVKQWIPTGSTWLDCIIARGKRAGIPVSKISELAGLERVLENLICQHK